MGLNRLEDCYLYHDVQERQKLDKQQSKQASAEQQKMDVLRQLVTIMTDKDMPLERRRNAKQSLLKIGNHSIVGMLREILEKTQDDTILTDAIEVLGFLPLTPDVADTLLMLLWCQSPTVRQSAIRALSQIGDSKAASVLSVIIVDSQSPDTIFDAKDGELAKESRDKILLRLDN